jgi:hypothetical protein
MGHPVATASRDPEGAHSLGLYLNDSPPTDCLGSIPVRRWLGLRLRRLGRCLPRRRRIGRNGRQRGDAQQQHAKSAQPLHETTRKRACSHLTLTAIFTDGWMLQRTL